ncbi:hypothetical protein JVT61DRAFT_6998 [Boletus reticuloceps]|uniref:RRM domain-containing protein n=1 Tax=Boletus reticuloceps TaxID=495285 RepID=A0A8I3A5Z6_9AGAM|nr:hypothetical protein JVT61DRAFT_6998 [Boletus reticuloceps]
MDSADARSHPPNGSTQDNDTHLWIPEPEARHSSSDPAPSSSRAPQLLRERLYVGNLSPTVDEYALLQVFTKFGKIAKLDFLFHKSGVNKGKSRGYAFVEFMSEAVSIRVPSVVLAFFLTTLRYHEHALDGGTGWGCMTEGFIPGDVD